MSGILSMTIEVLNVLGQMVPHTIVPIVGDGACLFRALSNLMFIPRIPLIPSEYPFEFKRLQFPLKVCFAMTINKSQGQSLKLAGIDLREDCFSHGQFYVACSRVSSPSSLVILASEGIISNVVYKEILI